MQQSDGEFSFESTITSKKTPRCCYNWRAYYVISVTRQCKATLWPPLNATILPIYSFLSMSRISYTSLNDFCWGIIDLLSILLKFHSVSFFFIHLLLYALLVAVCWGLIWNSCLFAGMQSPFAYLMLFIYYEGVLWAYTLLYNGFWRMVD